MCRGIQGHPYGIFWRLRVLYQNMFTVLFFNGLCTSNMFMVLQVVVLWLYTSYKFCVVIYSITKIYLSTNIYFIGGWDGRGLTSKMLRLGWWLPYLKNTSWIAYISLQRNTYRINIWNTYGINIWIRKARNLLNTDLAYSNANTVSKLSINMIYL